MKYKTIIEIISDANDRNEAIDIAGEFLRGEFEASVKMSYNTKPVRSHVVLKTGAMLSLALIVGSFAILNFSNKSNVSFGRTKNVSACVAPLKTSDNAEFKNDWEEEGNKKALEYITKQ